jgi:hypothetical protein
MNKVLITCLCVVGAVFLASFPGSADGAKFIAFTLAVKWFLIYIMMEE